LLTFAQTPQKVGCRGNEGIDERSCLMGRDDSLIAQFAREDVPDEVLEGGFIGVLGSNIMWYSTVTRYLGEAKFPLLTGKGPMPAIESLSTTPMKPSCPLSTKFHLGLCGSPRDSPSSLQQSSAVTWFNPSGSRRVKFVWCPMLYQMPRKLSE
jgi:hypothetical protein